MFATVFMQSTYFYENCAGHPEPAHSFSINKGRNLKAPVRESAFCRFTNVSAIALHQKEAEKVVCQGTTEKRWTP